MEKVKIECEIVTPLFLHGADGETPEIRIPSIKGIMRYWWRAINYDNDLNSLRTKEGELFGSSDNNKQSKSNLIIKLEKVFNLKSQKETMLKHKEKSHSANAFTAGKFILILMSKNNIEYYKNLFILTTILGGFGKRSRRGFGSIRVTKINDKDYTYLTSLAEIHNLLSTLKQGKFVFTNNEIIGFKEKARYPVIKKIQIGSGYRNYNELLKKIGNSTHNNKSDCLGHTKSRFASPIYVSVIKNNDLYLPIITTLETVDDQATRVNNFISKQEEFKKGILQ